MKKILLLLAVIINLNCFAQHVHAVRQVPINTVSEPHTSAAGNPSAKTTSPGDTLILQNSPDTTAHTVYAYGADSGYVYGTNYWGDQAFAEQYNADEGVNVQVIGVMALFGGKVSPASPQTVTFYAWDQGPLQLITGSLYYNGFPNNILDSLVVPVTQLGIGATSDTMKEYFFPSGTGNIYGRFFVGYGIYYNYLALTGDTIGLASTLNGVSNFANPAALYTVDTSISEFGDTTVDTAVNVQNATFGADNNWYDNYTQYDSLFNNLFIYPIVVTGFPTSTKGITRNNFTFYGNYPNPCVNNTNVQFSLTTNAGVTLQLMDMNGNVLNTIKQTNLTAGEHTIPINTTTLPSGDYLYLIRTAAGDGIAGKMTVIH